MTLHEAIGVKNADIDVTTGVKLTHSEIYGRAIDLLGGLDTVAQFIPFTIEVLRGKYRQDKYFNNTPIKVWDTAAGFASRGASCELVGGGIWYLYHKHGIDCASCSDGVCVLKEAARRLVEREGVSE